MKKTELLARIRALFAEANPAPRQTRAVVIDPAVKALVRGVQWASFTGGFGTILYNGGVDIQNRLN